jgi:hypothetical protein
LSADHAPSRQDAIAASSRCCARRTGFWGLQRRAVRRRPTWVGWYTTPTSARITSATRFRGQTWPRNPEAAGRRCNKAGRGASCSADSRRGAPGDGRGWRASVPPTRARGIHWLTAASLPPSASAIWRWDQPCCLRRQACHRRAAVQWWGVGFMPGRVAPPPSEVKLLML